MRAHRVPGGRKRPRRSRLGAAPLFAALLALGLIAIQLARLGHMQLVAHVVCEHGALVHDHHDDAAPARAQAARAGERGTEPRALPGASDAGHDHCDPYALQPMTYAVAPAYVVPTLLDGALLPWSARPRRAEHPIALLALAPKGSPPA